MTVETITGAALIVTARDTAIYSNVGSLVRINTVSTVQVGSERAIRATAGYVAVSDVPNLSSDDFTVETWARVSHGQSARPVWSRVNGNTELSLTVLADGTPRFYAASAQGGYRLTLDGTVRIDDGQFHYLAVKADYRVLGTINFSLWVDGVQVRAGKISPGLFAARPDFAMTSAVNVGGRPGTPFKGDVLVFGWHSKALADTVLARRWAARPHAVAAARVGWGIVL